MRRALFAALCVVLAGCDAAPVPPVAAPPARPDELAPPPAPAGDPTARATESRQLAAYYARVQADLLAQGLLRTDGGGPDTPYGSADILRNFERIAFFDEYTRGAGLRPGRNVSGRLKRWPGPVRIAAEFGASVPPARRTRDANAVRGYAARLAQVTGHPISVSSPRAANFHVLFMGEDDRDELLARVRGIVPDIAPDALAIFDDLPRSIHCLVLAFSGTSGGYDYARAIAFIRAEHPDLMRLACIHEEMAQGLGLANDSPRARPSIFNDDDEFALLTTHDEELLRLLYDPRLEIGMRLEEARPILRDILEGRDAAPES
ncbi:DUF2927 domain-containing protein [Rhodosalinus sp. 5P4]|uniref:DUF2927 domain-containing protein n=1 Tax=Rhodosalinus sp. 5P4 TaxID=3239196 RepID=UPI003526AD42